MTSLGIGILSWGFALLSIGCGHIFVKTLPYRRMSFRMEVINRVAMLIQVFYLLAVIGCVIVSFVVIGVTVVVSVGK